MARAIEFPEQNDVIGRPENMCDNQCYGLPVARIMTFVPGPDDQSEPQAVPAHISCWEFTPEEIAEINKTGKGYLKIIGYTTYPLSVHGQLPIYNHNGPHSDVILSKDDIEQLKGK